MCVCVYCVCVYVCVYTHTYMSSVLPEETSSLSGRELLCFFHMTLSLNRDYFIVYLAFPLQHFFKLWSLFFSFVGP